MRLFARISILILSVVLLAGCGESYSWHQKLTVMVETPNSMQTGSSVQSVTKSKQNFIPGQPGGSVISSLRGEAVAVDLGGGHFLFALLRNGRHRANASDIAQKVFAKEIGLDARPYTRWPDWARNITRLRGQRKITEDYYPMLVTFDDINNPATVREVDPNNLAATFGEGYSLKSITLEIIDEPVTSGKVEKVLGWLRTIGNKQLDGDRYRSAKAPNQIANSLNILDFVRNAK